MLSSTLETCCVHAFLGHWVHFSWLQQCLNNSMKSLATFCTPWQIHCTSEMPLPCLFYAFVLEGSAFGIKQQGALESLYKCRKPLHLLEWIHNRKMTVIRLIWFSSVMPLMILLSICQLTALPLYFSGWLLNCVHSGSNDLLCWSWLTAGCRACVWLCK